jgi:hypothetical protein
MFLSPTFDFVLTVVVAAGFVPVLSGLAAAALEAALA